MNLNMNLSVYLSVSFVNCLIPMDSLSLFPLAFSLVALCACNGWESLQQRRDPIRLSVYLS